MPAPVDFQTRQIIQPFDLQRVTLGPGRFRNQLDATLDYFLSIPSDDMLVGFRRRAGLPHPGVELGGWYSNEASFTPDWDEIFNPFGQWVSGLSRLYAVTQDPRALEKVVYLVSEWGKTIEPDGYFYYSRNCNAQHYVYEKMVCGLVDAYLYCGFETAKKYLATITRWAIGHLARYRLPATPKHPVGQNPLIRGVDNEWYTLSENLYRAYLATGDPLYRDFAREWHYDYYWDALAAGHSAAMTDLHGYSHVNNLSGAAMAYQATGESKYLDTITRAYALIKRHQLMASGGYAPDERMASPEGSNGRALETISSTFEVVCGSWAGFKLSRYLLSFTGQAEYGEWIETLLYNGIGAALPMRDDAFRRGRTHYYADYRITGGRKVYHPVSFPCCSGTYPQAVAEYANLIYYRDADSLYISQFIPSQVRFDLQGTSLSVEQKTAYPEEETVSLLIHANTETTFSLKLRLPAWADINQIQVAINGEEAPKSTIDRGWLVLTRRWQPKDCVLLRIPMALRFVPIAPAYPNRAALMVGPVMLALVGNQGGPLAGPISAPDTWIDKQSAEPLRFRLKDDPERGLFIPFYEVPERTTYFVYFDILPAAHAE